MNNLIRYVCFLAMAAAAPITSAEDTVQILRAGLWHGDQVTVESGPDWWGIFPEGDGFTLQQAPLTITLEYDGIVDEEGQATGKMVKVPQEAEPVLLVHGIAGLKEGRLEVVEEQLPRRMLYPGQSVSFRLRDWKDGTYLSLGALGEANDPGDFREVVVSNYELKIHPHPKDNITSQTVALIAEVGVDAEPRLVWAGDLDRDDKIDLLIDATFNGNVTRLFLYLSSAAKKGELVGKVAEWTTTGC